MSLEIKEVYVEYQKSPIGLDEKKPRFSWIWNQMNKISCKLLAGFRYGRDKFVRGTVESWRRENPVEFAMRE